MANQFVKVSDDLFKQLTMESGLLLKTFDPTASSLSAYLTSSNIICDTTGDVSATCTATYSDMGEDVNNCPNGMKELKHLDGWECGMSFTALNITPSVLRLALGAASVVSGKVTPTKTLDVTGTTHFSDVWLLCDLVGGGYVAIHLMNALSGDGLSIKFGKNIKGSIDVNLNGHFSIDDQDTVPMEFYVTAST